MSEALLSQSHVDTLAQVLALVDEKGFPHRATPHKGLSPVQLNFCQVFRTIGRTVCVSDQSSQKGISTAYPHRQTNKQIQVVVTNTKKRILILEFRLELELELGLKVE